MSLTKRILLATASLAVSHTTLAAISFAPAANTPTGSRAGPGPAAEAMVAADLNNGGYADIIAADWFGSGIRVLLNDGDGSFGPAIVTELGTSTGSVSAADFNEDGWIDVAVATGAELIILQGLGDGTFTPISSRPLSPAGQIQAYALDANGDGHADIVAPSTSGILTFLGQGNGQFVDGPTTFVPGILSATAQMNYNNDGIVDIAVADGAGQRVVVLTGNGDGSFSQSTSVFVGFIPEDVVTGDLNGDGIDDIATADSFSFSMSIVLSQSPGHYALAQRYFGVLGPVSLRLADFDLDGDRDVAIVTVVDSRVYVYANAGNGSLGAPQKLAVTRQPQTPAIADYNLDGKPDIAVAGASGELSVLLNTSP